ncbi:unnamed protein product [Prorocentrum cordatum]|uniref:Uncharacterized protein n=1 Tax=Prorocentrum cordatum TaxID=2364126 RepID=A0ABN9PL50_9DINO|nr:unnamed protein product [Polarella glacialis]
MRWSAPGRVRQGGSDARCRAGRGAWHRAATSVPRRGSRRGSSKKNRHGVRSQTVLGLQGGPRQAPRPSGKDCRDAKPSLGERVGPSGGPVRHRAIAYPAARCQRAHIELAWCTTGRGLSHSPACWCCAALCPDICLYRIRLQVSTLRPCQHRKVRGP